MISLFLLKGNVQEYVTVCKKRYLKKWNVSAVGSFTLRFSFKKKRDFRALKNWNIDWINVTLPVSVFLEASSFVDFVWSFTLLDVTSKINRKIKYEFIFNQFVSLGKRFSVSQARELPTHVFHTPLARASLFAGYVYLRPHVTIKHSVKPTHGQSVLSSPSWQGAVKELNIYPIHSVSVALVSAYATSCQIATI